MRSTLSGAVRVDMKDGKNKSWSLLEAHPTETEL
jgi:hypothetical protein